MTTVVQDEPEVSYIREKIGSIEVLVLERIATKFLVAEQQPAQLVLQAKSGTYVVFIESLSEKPMDPAVLDYIGPSQAAFPSEAIEVYRRALKLLPTFK